MSDYWINYYLYSNYKFSNNFRPKRERKLPAHLKAGDFEYSYKGPNDNNKKKSLGHSKPASPAASTTSAASGTEELGKQSEMAEDASAEEKPDQIDIEDEIMKESDTEEEDDLNSEEDEEDDDPNKLWCICQQPHNNRFMICCDACSDWFHGKCVGITKKMGKEMEEAGNDWTCPKCKSQEEKSETERQSAKLKDKLKERETTAKKPQMPRSASKESLSTETTPKKVKILSYLLSK